MEWTVPKLMWLNASAGYGASCTAGPMATSGVCEAGGSVTSQLPCANGGTVNFIQCKSGSAASGECTTGGTFSGQSSLQAYKNPEI